MVSLELVLRELVIGLVCLAAQGSDKSDQMQHNTGTNHCPWNQINPDTHRAPHLPAEWQMMVPTLGTYYED